MSSGSDVISLLSYSWTLFILAWVFDLHVHVHVKSAKCFKISSISGDALRQNLLERYFPPPKKSKSLTAVTAEKEQKKPQLHNEDRKKNKVVDHGPGAQYLRRAKMTLAEVCDVDVDVT